MLRQNLIKTRHMILEASGGADGLRLARATRPDLICLDLTMPDVDGFEVMRALRATPPPARSRS